jgi:hypothetical protein
MHTRYSLEPINICATKREVDEYNYRLDTMGITEIGEGQAMMIMVKETYINNLGNVSTDIERMHMDPEIWHQQQTLDDAHHLNRHMIEVVQKYMRGDATRMETYIELYALVYEHQSCKGIFAQRMLTPDAIQPVHADYYDLPDDTRINSSPNPSNKQIKLLEEVTIDDSEQSLQTISPILVSEETGTQLECMNQKAPLMSRNIYFQTG